MPVIIISGGAGSGKSTVARVIAKKFGLRHISVGETLREIASSMGYETSGKDYLKFHKYQKTHLEIDKKVDKLLLKELIKGNCVVDTRLMAYLFKGKAYKILLKVPDVVAAKRNALREGISKKEALKTIQKRNRMDLLRYKGLYNIDLADTGPFDLVLDTSHFSIKEMNSIILFVLNKLFV